MASKTEHAPFRAGRRSIPVSRSERVEQFKQAAALFCEQGGYITRRDTVHDHEEILTQLAACSRCCNASL